MPWTRHCDAGSWEDDGCASVRVFGPGSRMSDRDAVYADAGGDSFSDFRPIPLDPESASSSEVRSVANDEMSQLSGSTIPKIL
jgi:hypothetical protein